MAFPFEGSGASLETSMEFRQLYSAAPHSEVFLEGSMCLVLGQTVGVAVGLGRGILLAPAALKGLQNCCHLGHWVYLHLFLDCPGEARTGSPLNSAPPAPSTESLALVNTVQYKCFQLLCCFGFCLSGSLPIGSWWREKSRRHQVSSANR